MNIKKILTCMAFASVLAGPAQAQETINLRLADQLPLSHAASQAGVQPFIKMIEERSNGKIKIQHFPAQQLAKAPAMLDAVSSGLVDIAFVGMVYVTEKMVLTSVVELPGLYTDPQKAAMALDSLIKSDLMEQEYLANNVRPLFLFISPQYQLLLANKGPITDISQVSGLKVRAAGSTAELIAQSIGATPVRMSSSDTYVAVERGTLDGLIYSSPGAIAYKLENLLQSATTNATLGSLAFGMLINDDTWQRLPEDLQKVLTEVGDEMLASASARYNDDFLDANKKLTEAGVEVYELSPELSAVFNERLKTVREDWVAQVSSRGLPAAEILEKFEANLQAQN